jgi:hypothetical protein
MATWEPFAGATLHMPSGPAIGSGKHLFVVLNDPKTFPDYGTALCVALVSLTSVPKEIGVVYDQTCVLAAGCHPSIRHDSFVYYKRTRIEQVRHILSLVEQGVYVPGEPVSAQLLTQVRQGLLNSPFTSREFKRLGI